MEMYNLSLCRICAKFKTENADNIFEENQREKLRQIEKLTGKRLINAKDLPQHICTKCSTDLENAYEFRVRCITVQYYFTTPHYKNKLNQSDQISPNTAFEEIQSINIESNKEEAPNTMNSRDDNDTDNLLNTISNLFEDDDNNQSFNESSAEETALKVLNSGDFIIEKERHTEERKKSTKHKIFMCELCGRWLSNRSHFVIHMRRHTGTRPYQCELCSDKFITISDLTRHKRRHTGERPFACSHCGKSFMDYSSRRKHENIHINKRPCKCTHCDKSFRDSYALKTHMVGHTGEYNFHCVTCNKSFLRKHFLLKHYRSKIHKETESKKQLENDELGNTVF